MDTRETILNGAAKCLSENPAAGLNRIAEVAGVGRATLYRHFASKEELVEALTDDAVALTETALDQIRGDETISADALERMFDCLIPVGIKYHFLLSQPEIYSSKSMAVLQKQEEEMLQLIRAGKESGIFSREFSDEWISLMINYMIYISWEALNSGIAASKLVSKMAVNTLLKGCGN